MHTQHKSSTRGENKCLPREIDVLKNDHDGRWGIMSIPLMEIKVDIMDPGLLYYSLLT